MSLFIPDAWAQNGPPAGADQFSGILFMIVIFAVFYFVLIRPQAKRAKEHKKMVGSLAKGDEVVTNGGLLGKVTQVGENFIAVELADGVQVKVQRQAVASVMPKGTMKSL